MLASRRSASTARSCPCGAHTIVARSGTSSGSTIVSRLSTCCGPISTSTRSRPTAMWPGLWTASSAATVAQASSVVRPWLDRGDDQPRRVVAPDPREPVLDLAAEAAVDDHDEVHHPRGHERAVRLVAAAEQVAQRRLDRARRRVPRAPDVLAHSLRHSRSPSSPSAAAGPAEPDVVRLQRPVRRRGVPVLEDRVDDRPLRVDLVVAGEQRRVAAHRVEDQPLVGLRRLRHERAAVEELHVHGPDPHASSRGSSPRARARRPRSAAR